MPLNDTITFTRGGQQRTIQLIQWRVDYSGGSASLGVVYDATDEATGETIRRDRTISAQTVTAAGQGAAAMSAANSMVAVIDAIAEHLFGD